MKKTSIFLSLLGVCLGIGIVLIIVGFAMGGHIGNLNLSINPILSHGSVSHTLSDVSLTDTTDIQNLDFDLAATSVKVRAGETFSISGGDLSRNEISNGTWIVESKSPFELNFFGHHVRFPDLISFNDDKAEIIITIPEDVVLSCADFNLKTGDLTIDKLDCKEDIALNLSAGNINISSLTANKASFDVSLGDIDVKQYNIANSIAINCSLGDVTLGNKKYATKNFCNDLTTDCSMGNVDIYGKLTGENYIDVSMGDINLNLVGSNVNYAIGNNDSDMGDISYTTKDFINNSNDMAATDDKSKYGTLNLSCSMGDIDVCYLYASIAE